MESERIARLPKTPVVIDGVSYNLCGAFPALVEAESYFLERGREVNLAAAIVNRPDASFKGPRQLLPAALRTFHPEIDYIAAQSMIDRALSKDDPAFIHGLERMWPPETEETEAANHELRLDLDSLAEANEHLGGKTGLTQIFVDKPLNLGHIYRIFPCALHRFRQELSIDEAPQLMTRKSVFVVVGAMELIWPMTPEKTRQRFVDRVMAVASDEEKQEFLFRALAKMSWPGAAEA